jgi:hypothetical protein
MKAIEKEELGKDDITDFLTVSFSSTDYEVICLTK